MKVLRLHKPFDMRFHEEPMPEYGPDEVLLRVESVGVCASDIHYYREGKIGDQVVVDPVIMGHEFSGTVVKAGKNVTSLAEGARVAVEPGKPCGKCAMCKEGNIHICPNVEFFGTPPIDGSLREYVAWPAELCIEVSDNISFDEAAAVEPLAVGVYAVELAGMSGGETIAILGAGAIGLSVLQAAKVVGMGKIIVSDPIPERREIAKKLGADVVTTPEQCKSVIMSETEFGADLAFECAGMPEAIAQTVEIVRPKAKVIIVGIPEEDHYCFGASASRRRELTIQLVRRCKNTGAKSVELVEKGLIDVKSFATHAFPFDKAEDAFKLAMEKTDGVVRAMIRVSE